MSDAEFSDRCALVTAGSKGLGIATATELARRGATIAIVSRSSDNLASARDTIKEEAGCSDQAIVTESADLANVEETNQAIQSSIDTMGGLDVLVTNHGGPPVQSIADTSVDTLDNAYESVLRGTFVTLQTALPALADGGVIVNIVSASVLEPLPGDILQNFLRPGIYAVSKSLAKEYGPDVRVNCVSPRGILTDRIEYKLDLLAEENGITRAEAIARRTDELAVDELGRPEDFAKAVAFLASDDARYITGSYLPIDGGWHASAF